MLLASFRQSVVVLTLKLDTSALHPVSSEISDQLLFASYFASLSNAIKFGDYFLMCVVQIKTFWLDVKYPQQATVRE